MALRTGGPRGLAPTGYTSAAAAWTTSPAQRTRSRIRRAMDRRVGEPPMRCLGHAEVDDLRHRLAVIDCHEDFRRLEVAVDDPFLMRVLHRLGE